MKPAHTPGPWTVQKLNHARGDLWLQIGHYRDGSEVGPVAGIVGDETREPTFKPVAGLKYLVTDEAEQWANARLIAASPKMLAALRKVADYAKSTKCGALVSMDYTGAVLTAVREAIADVEVGPLAGAQGVGEVAP